MRFGKKRSAAKTENPEESMLTPPADEQPAAASEVAAPAAEQPSAAPPAPRQTANPQAVNPQLDESKLLAAYANFARVTGTPEEVILDFGLNPEPFSVPASTVGVSKRIVVNLYTAKRLQAALQITLQRHEAAFGNVETDVQKRVKQPSR